MDTIYQPITPSYPLKKFLFSTSVSHNCGGCPPPLRDECSTATATMIDSHCVDFHPPFKWPLTTCGDIQRRFHLHQGWHSSAQGDDGNQSELLCDFWHLFCPLRISVYRKRCARTFYSFVRTARIIQPREIKDIVEGIIKQKVQDLGCTADICA